ncbi:uncharacterized protein LOC108584546 isoform X2 [Papio anubis]|uniref:uncharacterized protein LOC108584546 isoform X2 n=1 Tax=Papio anubis TaxID=9555 RepID=UPI00083EB12A|nr:uncharacterized protein LOC108584546 isoform X2 [Papio anubis]
MKQGVPSEMQVFPTSVGDRRKRVGETRVPGKQEAVGECAAINSSAICSSSTLRLRSYQANAVMGGSTGSSEVFCFWPGTFLPFGGEDTAAKVFIETCFVLGNMPDVGDKMQSCLIHMVFVKMTQMQAWTNGPDSPLGLLLELLKDDLFFWNQEDISLTSLKLPMVKNREQLSGWRQRRVRSERSPKTEDLDLVICEISSLCI